MPDEAKPRLGPLQLAIMKVLWEHGPASVTEVHKTLPGGSEFAYTTIATMLRKMEARGLVRHREEGRRFVYEPAVSELGVITSMADDLLDRLFDGRLADMVSHLLKTRDVSRDELDTIDRLIAARKRKR